VARVLAVREHAVSPPDAAAPVAERPTLDGYGIATTAEGLMPWSWADTQLREARNYWICSTRPDGRPHAMPVWGTWTGTAVLFGTGPSSVKARNLAGSPPVTVHLESGDDVVIVEGVAERMALDSDEGRRAFEALGDAFEVKYSWRPSPDDEEMALFRVVPARAYGWREKDFVTSATRWKFSSG
jgi:PPOX class probable F420-dependent enzyme